MIVSYQPSFPESSPSSNKLDRHNILEWRIGVQESITLSLLEKISILKGEMLEHLKLCKFLEKEQAKNKESFSGELGLLRGAITNMNKEIQVFEENVRDKWKTVNAAAATLKNLEDHQTAGLTDVRGRITRSDQAISTLSQRVNQIGEEIRSLNEYHKRELVEINSLLKANEQKFTEMDLIRQLMNTQKSGDFANELERSKTSTNATIRRIEESIQQHLLELERRMNQELTELHHHVHRTATECVDERSRLEERTTEAVKHVNNEIQQRIINVERKAEELKVDEELTSRVEDLEVELADFKHQVLKTFKELEARMNRMADDQFELHRKSIDEVQAEMRQGFTTMRDTVTNMKSVLEHKIRISEENLQIEMTQLRKLVVLV